MKQLSPGSEHTLPEGQANFGLQQTRASLRSALAAEAVIRWADHDDRLEALAGRPVSPVSSDSKTIARTAAAAFGGTARVNRYWDDHHQHSVDVLSCTDAPLNGVNSYATIGLSDSLILKDGAPLDVRVEFVAACGAQTKDFERYLSTAAFCVINSRWFVAPGTIFPNVLRMYDASPTMDHLLFLPPFLWEGRLKSIALEAKTIAWLLAIPISESELRFAETFGLPELEGVFEKCQIDIFDFERAPVR